MRFIVRLLTVACCILVLRAPPADAKRVALVIGNGEYKIVPLANPVNDAEAVAAAFKSQLKFDQVILRKDLKLDGFRDALREMARAAAGAELGVVFFAGHGIELGGRNFLIPTDAALAAPGDVDLEAIALDTVLRQLDGVTKLRLVILDACRNNPFPAAKRSTTRGLGRVEPDGGTLIAYAAKDGTTADDGKGGRHSPFTAALLKHIVAPGLDVRRVFGYVSEDVLAATSRAQEPYLYGRLGGDEVHLIPAADAKPVVLSSPPSADAAAQAWAAVKDSTIIAQLEAIVRRFPGTVYADFATARIEALKKQQISLVTPPTKTPEPIVTALDPKHAPTPLTAVEERALKPKDTFKECAECPEMVVVPAGSFTMGSSPSEIAALKKEQDIFSKWYDSEGPQRRVTIARPFAVGRFEATFAEWDACLATGGCTHRPDDNGWGRGKRPVIKVSWNDVTEQYLPWLSLKTGKTYRLLTEAEWEYVARAGTTTRYSFGDSIFKSQAQFREDKSLQGGKTVAVGSFQPNAFGLHDMHGNISEWVQGCWNGSYRGLPSDGSAWSTGDCIRMTRGGSWTSGPEWLRAASRSTASGRGVDAGFRVARTL